METCPLLFRKRFWYKLFILKMSYQNNLKKKTLSLLKPSHDEKQGGHYG